MFSRPSIVPRHHLIMGHVAEARENILLFSYHAPRQIERQPSSEEPSATQARKNRDGASVGPTSQLFHAHLPPCTGVVHSMAAPSGADVHGIVPSASSFLVSASNPSNGALLPAATSPQHEKIDGNIFLEMALLLLDNFLSASAYCPTRSPSSFT